ncbi:TnsD family Tn7-like transposition protein [Vogesella sp. DC21W]|uniref:TnsD family Tn7-like transposition protein n=1 Tax=Vogesella aquatica TaxID=2984206 RepID=A0ABT5J2Q1_9NEIS|nr:TnsD family Tn7-like transposition protein [Vogesella aquatica]MDC7718922.1 TnsD family Tn7-like transposition protein [Vogesella aquatica]
MITRSAYPLLARIPDETLFSWVSRLNKFWGLPSNNQTCQIIFGQYVHNICHAFPDHLKKIKIQIGDDSSTDVFLMEGTLLGFYRTFLSQAAFASARNDLLLGWGRSLSKRLSWLAYQKRTNHPLKACPRCIEEDRRQTGWSYWHLAHQWPGVWVCQIHDVSLQVLDLCDAATFKLVLPFECIEHLRSVVISDPLLDSSRSLAHFISSIVREGGVLQADVLQALYYQKLYSYGWINNTGQKQWDDAASSYIEHCRSLASIPELHFLPETVESSGRVLCQLLNDEKLVLHPLRHLLIMHWLWGDASTFWSDYYHHLKMPREQVDTIEFEPPLVSKELPSQAELKAIYTTVGGSLSNMADVLGISLPQLRKQLRLRGIFMKFELVGSSEWATQLGSALDKGLTSMELSKLLKFPRTQICAAIHRDQAMLVRWKNGRRARRIEEAREHLVSLDISSCFEAKPLPLQLKYKLCWFLIRHDKVWLLEHLRNRVSEWAQLEKPGFDFSEADISLSAQMLLYSIRSRMFPQFKFVNSRSAFQRHIPGFSVLGRRFSDFPLSGYLLTSLTRSIEK